MLNINTLHYTTLHYTTLHYTPQIVEHLSTVKTAAAMPPQITISPADGVIPIP